MLKVAKIARLSARDRRDLSIGNTIRELVKKTHRASPGLPISQDGISVRAEDSRCFDNTKKTSKQIFRDKKARYLRKAAEELGPDVELVKHFDEGCQCKYSYFCFISPKILSKFSVQDIIDLKIEKHQMAINHVVRVIGHAIKGAEDFADSKLLSEKTEKDLDKFVSALTGWEECLDGVFAQKLLLEEKKSDIEVAEARKLLAKDSKKRKNI